MGWSAAAAVVAAIASFASSQISQSQAQSAANAQAEYQARVAEANRQALQNQAQVEQDAARIKQQELDEQRSAVGRQFRQQQGKNVAALAATGADIASGSALDLLEGNIDMYSQDIATNTFQKQILDWETKNKIKTLNWQADVAQSQSSYFRGTINNSGPSVLTSGLSALGAGLSTYASFGGGNPFGKSAGGAASSGAAGATTGVHANTDAYARSIAFNWG